MAVTGPEDNDSDSEGGRDHGTGPARPQFRVVPHAPDAAPRPGIGPVHLLREYKGLTVADLLRDEIVDHLPGQVRTALHHIQRGDFAAADRALPGDFPPVLQGPRRGTPSRLPLLSWLLLTAVFAAVALASLWF